MVNAHGFDESPGAPAPLRGVRALDLGSPYTSYATKLLADLGADVILVEPPGGIGARGLPPFYRDEPGNEGSLPFWFFNTSKRGVTCDLRTADGRELFTRLVDTAQIVVAPGAAAMEALCCPCERFRERKSALVWASVSGFGDSGPHSGWLAPDIVGVAMSGIMTLAGYPDRPPYMPAGDQGYLAASIHAAQGVLLALRVVERGGPGQRVEVSMQEALSMAQETAMQTWDMQRTNRKRVGETRMLPGFGTYECADGYVYSMVGVPAAGAGWGVMLEWMQREGKAEDLSQEPWPELLSSVNRRTLTALMGDPEKLAEFQGKMAHVEDVLRRFFAAFPKRYLYEEGQKQRLLIGPVNSPKDLAENAQLEARGWWRDVEHPELGRTLRYPGPPFRLARSPWRIRHRAPLLGEHNVEVWHGELGLSLQQLSALAGAGVL